MTDEPCRNQPKRFSCAPNKLEKDRKVFVEAAAPRYPVTASRYSLSSTRYLIEQRASFVWTRTRGLQPRFFNSTRIAFTGSSDADLRAGNQHAKSPTATRRPSAKKKSCWTRTGLSPAKRRS